jgi:hypothetical protein
VLDIDATIVIAHSEKELAAPTWKKTFGFHPLICWLDRPEVSSGEALAATLGLDDGPVALATGVATGADRAQHPAVRFFDEVEPVEQLTRAPPPRRRCNRPRSRRSPDEQPGVVVGR